MSDVWKVFEKTLIMSVCKERGGNKESDYVVKQDEKTGQPD